MKELKFRVTLVAIGIITCLSTRSQNFNQAKMDSLFMIYENYNRGMGSISLFQDGKEVYQNSIGFADLEKEIRSNANTQYRIGSITKMFTAVLFMKMVEEGKLSLDQKLADFYPQVPNADIISMDQLLKHRSGIFNVIAASDYIEWNEDPISKEVMLEKIVAYESQFEPGSKADYSNANYILMTYILEDVSNSSYAELVEQIICAKCGLERTEVGNSIETDKNEALSYFPANPWTLASETDMSVPLGAGAIVSTPTELNRFLECLYKGNLVKGESLKQMMELEDNFGLGMFTIPFYDKVAYGHTGGIDGFNSNSFHFINEDFSIAYTSNGMKSPINNLMIGVLSIYYGMDYELPEFSDILEMSTAELQQYSGVYSSPTFPLKLTITAEDNQLKAQATGQPSFVLEPVGVHKFTYERAGLTMEFMPEESKLIFKQMGATYELSRE